MSAAPATQPTEGNRGVAVYILTSLGASLLTLLIVPAAQTVSGRLMPWGIALLLAGMASTSGSFLLCPRRPWYAKAITLLLMLPVAYLAVFSAVGLFV